MKKVLVIDDDQDILFMLKFFLRMKGHDVIVSTSCREGMDLFYALRPEVVLLDINVGEHDGRLVCQQIKMQAAYQHIPVIFISANTDCLKTYSTYGANAAMEKPFNLEALYTLILQTQ